MSPDPWNDARARLEAAGLNLPTEWPNEGFSIPDLSMWLSVEASGDMLAPVEIGNGAWQEEGTFTVHVCSPVGSGSADARQVAKDIASAFRGVAGPVIYRRASIGSGAQTEDGMWWVLSVVIEWTYVDRPV
jgi:hypothetical protein